MEAKNLFLNPDKKPLSASPRSKKTIRIISIKNAEQAARTSTRDSIERETYSLISSIIPLLQNARINIENISKENVLSILKEINNGSSKLFAEKLEEIADNIFVEICIVKKNRYREITQVVNISNLEQLTYYKSCVKRSTKRLISLYDTLENSSFIAREKIRHNKKAIQDLLEKKTHSFLKKFLPLLHSMYGDLTKIDKEQIYEDLKKIIPTDSTIPRERLLYMSKLVEDRIDKLRGNFLHEIIRRSRNMSYLTSIEREEYISKIISTLEEIVTHLDRLDGVYQ